MLHDKFPTTAFVYIDGHPFSNHSAAAVLYLEYQVDRMYSVVKISSFPFYMYIIYNIHAVAILWSRLTFEPRLKLKCRVPIKIF